MLKALFAAGLLLTAVTLRAADPYDRVGERARIMTAYDSIRPKELTLTDLEAAQPGATEFLFYFRDHIFPVLERKRVLSFQCNTLSVAKDRALFDNEAEESEWEARIVSLKSELDAIGVDPTWQAHLKEWARLSVGLEGYLPRYARDEWRRIELAEFTPTEKPLLDRLTALGEQVRRIQNNSPVAAHLDANEKATNDLLARFYAREISFDQATHELTALLPTSLVAMGQDIATRGRDQFNEMAIVRTQLAKSKGYRNWAEYKVAEQSPEYTDLFNSVQQRLAFLRGLLEMTEEPYGAFLKKRTRAIPGANENRYRRVHLPLLALPAETLVRPYLKKEQAGVLWRQVMLESGFTPAHLDQITWDNFSRPGKQTHAYMWDIILPSVRELRISARDFSAPWDSANSVPGNIQIVQNLRDDGARSYNVTLHEGGHGLDFGARRNPLNEEGSNAWAETHSTLFEAFQQEVEFLERAAVLGGVPIPPAMSQAFLQNSGANALAFLRRQLANAIFDIEVWNYDYDQGSENYVDRSRDLYNGLIYKALRLRSPETEGIEWGYSSFSTDHFTSGSVRYIGYIQAFVSAEVTRQHLLELFQKETGRRSLMRQPTMAGLLNTHYFAQGALKPYPIPVEEFTGRPFSADDYVAAVIANAAAYQPGPGDYTTSGDCGSDVAAHTSDTGAPAKGGAKTFSLRGLIGGWKIWPK